MDYNQYRSDWWNFLLLSLPPLHSIPPPLPKFNFCQAWKAKETLQWFAWKISHALMHKENGYLHLGIGDFVVLILFPLNSPYLSSTTCYLIVWETWKFEELNWKLTSKSVKNKNIHIHTLKQRETHLLLLLLRCIANKLNKLKFSLLFYYSTEKVQWKKTCE